LHEGEDRNQADGEYRHEAHDIRLQVGCTTRFAVGHACQGI
jgi:hypothetical protein